GPGGRSSQGADGERQEAARALVAERQPSHRFRAELHRRRAEEAERQLQTLRSLDSHIETVDRQTLDGRVGVLRGKSIASNRLDGSLIECQTSARAQRVRVDLLDGGLRGAPCGLLE